MGLTTQMGAHMKWILLVVGIAVAFPTVAQNTSKYILSNTPQQLVFLDNYPTGGQRTVVFSYYEVYPQFRDYLFVSIIRADCQTPNRLQTTQTSAAHIRYGIGKDIPPLSAEDRMWKVFAVGSVESYAWSAVCFPQRRNPQKIWKGSSSELLQAYQNPT